jgi:hypothetical protein
MLEDLNNKPKPSVTPTPTTTDADTEELNKYRELERQAILKELPKDIQEEFKEKTLKEVKDIDKVYRSYIKKDVGQTPPTTSTQPEKTEGPRWDPIKQKNVWD